MADQFVSTSVKRSRRAGRRDYSSLFSGRAEIVVLTVMMSAHIIHISAIFDLFYAQSTFVALIVQYVTFGIYAFVAGLRGHWKVLLISTAFLAYLVAQSLLYTTITGASLNLAAILSFGTLLMVMVFYETRLPLGTVLGTLLVISLIYVGLYIVLNPFILAQTGAATRLLLVADGVRENRVFLAGTFALFVMFTGLFQMRTRPILSTAMVALSTYAIYINQSRVFQLIAIAIAVAALIGMVLPGTRRPVSVGIALVFICLAIGNVWGYFAPPFNPYFLLGNDASGLARQFEFGDAVQSLRSHYPFGIGIAPSLESLNEFVRPRRPFYPSDLGVAGVFYQFGILGSALFVLGSVACIIALPSRAIRATPPSMALFYTTLQAAAGGFFAATLLGSSGTLFAALTCAIWLKGGYSTGRGPTGRRFDEVDPTASGIANR